MFASDAFATALPLIADHGEHWHEEIGPGQGRSIFVDPSANNLLHGDSVERSRCAQEGVYQLCVDQWQRAQL